MSDKHSQKSVIIKTKAWAKINLYLSLGEKMANGFHRIDTLFQSISLGDDLAIRIKRGTPGKLAIRCSCPELSNPANLAYRAAEDFFTNTRQKGILPFGLEIKLEKSIPVGAGLGGGSADAAAVLQEFARRPELLSNYQRAKRGRGRDTVEQRIFRIASHLGADVPFFLRGGIARGRGKGERLNWLSYQRQFWLVLIDPGFSLSTKLVYQWWDEFIRQKGNDYFRREKLTKMAKINKINRLIINNVPPPGWVGFLFNDLEKVVLPRYPLLGQIKQRLVENGALQSLMTGSGALVYGIFSTELAARKAEKNLKRIYPGIFRVRNILPKERFAGFGER